ncbi:signal transduction histidine kinase [Novosphingobium sp. PhB165]|uniref:ATP-binding protein n=1 Tax=Novosphingobium sp. PhB165 TaxID=2485105 RepID=UPI00104E581E|nr:ATP-binding protein [Novosphingobium sp. PhB165]TCM20844.1 signal transduction histidine kinase [Novosphingobium sp. PhB165]
MPRLRSSRLPAQAAILLLLLGLVQLAGSLLFYQSIDRQTLREDHARRIAELLVVSERIHGIDAGQVVKVMSTRHLDAHVATSPLVTGAKMARPLRSIAGEVVRWEPSLAGRDLHLAYSPGPEGRRDLVGSMRLADGTWLNFRSSDIGGTWPVAARATVLTLLTALACLAVGLLALGVLTRPLRRLARAADAIGHGQRVEIDEQGSADLRDLAHAMNVMQERIARLVEDQARSFEAISHDLRTPLARQRVVVDLVEDRELADILGGSIEEMEALIASLQGYLRAQHIASEPEEVDLGALVAGVAGAYGDCVQVSGPGDAKTRTYAEPVRLALSALVENAVRFGGAAQVRLLRTADGWNIEVEDPGAGIPARHFTDVLAPFFRIDEARSRDVPGFGLGIPTAHRLMMRFGGALSFEDRAQGGFVARIRVPAAPHS